jgi:hypothetical protein
VPRTYYSSARLQTASICNGHLTPLHSVILRLKLGQTSLQSMIVPHDRLMTGQSRIMNVDSLLPIASRDSLARALQLCFESAQLNTPSPGYTKTQHDRPGASSTVPERRSMRQHHP